MESRNVACQNGDCDLLEQEHERDFVVEREDRTEWGEWECPACHEINFYESERVYGNGAPESYAHARGEK